MTARPSTPPLVRAPSPALRDRVVSITVVAARGEVTVLPTPGAVLGVQLRGRVQAARGLLSPAGVTGIQGAARRYGYVDDAISVLVRFTPQGAACLGVPASALADASVALDDVLGARARGLAERLAGNTPAEAIAAVEALLAGLPLVADRRVAHAVDRLARGGDDARVAALAAELGMSERQLERRFLERVGVSPKRFASLCRLERASALARDGRPLADVAIEAGYFDQSHFVREFRRFAGAPPGAVLRG